jgi:hypothetical protein
VAFGVRLDLHLLQGADAEHRPLIPDHVAGPTNHVAGPPNNDRLTSRKV